MSAPQYTAAALAVQELHRGGCRGGGSSPPPRWSVSMGGAKAVTEERERGGESESDEMGT